MVEIIDDDMDNMGGVPSDGHLLDSAPEDEAV